MNVIKISAPVNLKEVNDIFQSISWGKISQDKWDKILVKSTFTVQILRDNTVIGFGRCVDDTKFCIIYDIVVHSDYQKQGIGKIILDEIAKYAQSQEFHSVRLFFSEDQPGLLEFYKKCGFKPVTNAMRLNKE